MMLASVFSAQPYWYNKARALSVLAQKWQGTDPDSVQMLMLESIADQCPLEGGKGVYIARNILAEYRLGETEYDDLAKCTSVIPRLAKSENSKISVYPNPAQETFFVESSSVIEKVVVTDLSGKLIYKNDVPGHQIKISNQGWLPGVYLVATTLKDIDKAEIQKLIIIP